MTVQDQRLHGATWFKSSYSGGTGNACVEVADLSWTDGGGVAIRDSKAPEGPVLLLRAAHFAAFVGGVRGGRLGA